MIEGVLTALVTPFKAGTKPGSAGPCQDPGIDFAAWRDLIEWQLSCGVNGLVIFGTTGESATLTTEEKLSLAKNAVEVVNGRVPVVAGCGSNATMASVAFTQALKGVGVDAGLAVTPYYNKPSQEGVYQHFKAIAEHGGLPLVLYNIPGRSCIKISFETFERLAVVKNIIGVKQAVDSVSELLELSQILEAANATLLAGDDSLVYAVMSVGGGGVISASANVIPEIFVELVEQAKSGNMKAALAAQRRAMPVVEALFSETNPAPAKAALKIMGRIPSDSLRLPLVPVTEKTRCRLRAMLVQEGDKS